MFNRDNINHTYKNNLNINVLLIELYIIEIVFFILCFSKKKCAKGWIETRTFHREKYYFILFLFHGVQNRYYKFSNSLYQNYLLLNFNVVKNWKPYIKS